jgi:DNA-binding response OmpR family regulator
MSLIDKILIVEDEFILANGLRLMLKEAGFEVCEIASDVPSITSTKNKNYKKALPCQQLKLKKTQQ